MTHVCHVVYCNMLLYVIVYCMLLYVCYRVLCSDSYSVPLNTPLTLYISDMEANDSSGGEDSARFPFTSWCLMCGHTVRSKRHAVKHFAYCPKPHQLRCGCCGNDYNWTAYVTHVNVRGVCKRHQLHCSAPFPLQPQYNVSCSRPFPQPSTGVAYTLASLAEATAPPAAAAGVGPPHFAMLTAASSDTPYQSHDYSSQQPTRASASSTAYAETPASSAQQTASIIVPLRSVTPLSDVDEDLERIIAEDFADAASQIASLPSAVSEPASSSLRSPEALTSASASVQPLYTALSPAAPISLDVASPAALPAAAASPAASSVSAASSAFPADPHIQVALAAQVLRLARVILAGTETTAQKVTDEASRELITLGGFWLTPLANPHEMPLHQLLRQLMPVWRTIFDQHRR